MHVFSRVLRLIPGLQAAEFVRFGLVHRNTYVNGPTVLAGTWQVRRHPAVFSNFYVSLVRVGEGTGMLQDVFLRLY